jgi:hypothetical protein
MRRREFTSLLGTAATGLMLWPRNALAKGADQIWTR